MTLPLFVPKADGGWYAPTVELAPGIFVEQCEPGERTPLLDVEELEPLWAAWEACRRWTGIGYEAERDFEKVSFRADARDLDVMYPRNWFTGERGSRVRLDLTFPASATLEDERELRLHPWAVEFPKTDRGDGKPGFVRRRFWFPSRHRVPRPSRRLREWKTKRHKAAATLAVAFMAARRWGEAAA